MFRALSIVVIMIMGIAGCNRPAIPALKLAKKEEPSPTPAESVTPAAGWTNSSPNPESSLPPPVATPAPIIAGFANPAANQAWNQYVDSFEAVKSVPPPQIQDPVNDSAEVAEHLQELGRRLQTLQDSRAALQNNLTSPEDKKRFRSAEKSLIDSSQ